MREAGEGCDDGNTTAGDGCNASCLIEDALPCNSAVPGATGDASCASGICDASGGGGGVCEPASTCGNGVREAGEGCDDGNTTDGDGCNASCLIEDAQPCNGAVPGSTGDASCASGVCDTTGGAPGVCGLVAGCGNGVLEAGEGCDDGNAIAGDGCNASCLVEDGMTCNDDTAGNVDGPSCAGGYCDSRGTCSRLGVSGGGCDAGASGAGTGGALVLLASLWLLATLRRRGALAGARACGAVVAVLAVFIGPSAASAQVSTGYSAERFELTSFRDGILGVEWADARGNGVFDFGFWMGYANDPVNVYEMSTGDRVGSLVHNRLGGDLVVATRLKDLIEFNFGASLIFAQSEDLGASTVGSDITSGGLGDIRLGGKLTVARRGGTAIALLAKVGIPTSTVADYGGDTWVTFSPAVAVSRTQGAVRLAANLGYVMRKSEDSLDLAVDDELFLRLGVGYRFASSLEVDGTFDVATGANDLFGAFNRNHAEARGGASFDVTSALRVFGAVGAGLSEGFGTPDWRALVGLRFGTSPKPPAEPAPRPLLPLPLPEPPKDSDGDGLIDVADRCPTEAETINAFEDADGCPDDPDPDHDGVIGTADQCPDAPEDLDGFEDGNGCPDPDNDSDTVLDTDDACRDVPGVVNMKGCPDPDRDGDTVVDRLDNCPDEPGSPANQGCKDKQLVVITGDKLDILETVFFKTNKAVIEKRSYNLLDNVAAVLASHSTIRVEVEGHTDDVGNDAYNKKLSQRRAEAVVAYLVRKGVDASRLQARGYGEEKPVADNKTKVGRATNRRVLFTILSAVEGVKPQSNGPTEDTIDR